MGDASVRVEAVRAFATVAVEVKMGSAGKPVIATVRVFKFAACTAPTVTPVATVTLQVA